MCDQMMYISINTNINIISQFLGPKNDTVWTKKVKYISTTEAVLNQNLFDGKGWLLLKNLSTSTRFCSHNPKYCWMQVWKCHHVRARILSFPLSLFGWFFSFAIYCNNLPPNSVFSKHKIICNIDNWSIGPIVMASLLSSKWFVSVTKCQAFIN